MLWKRGDRELAIGISWNGECRSQIGRILKISAAKEVANLEVMEGASWGN